MTARPHPAADIVAFFKARASLVVAAVGAVDAIAALLATLDDVVKTPDIETVQCRRQALGALIATGAVDGDNLLVARPGFAADPFVLCAVSRLPSGVVDLRTTELDRDTFALSGEPGRHPRSLDALCNALASLAAAPITANVSGVIDAIDAAAAQTRSVLSRLSIVKARVDLQESFLAAIIEEDVASAPLQLDSHLDHSGARGMALAARQQLSTGSHKIAGSNRQTVVSLCDNLRAGRT